VVSGRGWSLHERRRSDDERIAARLRGGDCDAFKADLDAAFCAKTEAKSRLVFTELTASWKPTYPGAVAAIERDLASLLRIGEIPWRSGPPPTAISRTTSPSGQIWQPP
jgi:hypothetical protein